MCEYDCNIEETSGLSQCYVAEPNMLTERVQPRLVDYAIALDHKRDIQEINKIERIFFC